MKPQLLTTNGKATHTSADGFVTHSGPVTVRLHPANSDSCATVQLNDTYHRADECVIADRKIIVGATEVTW